MITHFEQTFSVRPAKDHLCKKTSSDFVNVRIVFQYVNYNPHRSGEIPEALLSSIGITKLEKPRTYLFEVTATWTPAVAGILQELKIFQDFSTFNHPRKNDEDHFLDLLSALWLFWD